MSPNPFLHAGGGLWPESACALESRAQLRIDVKEAGRIITRTSAADAMFDINSAMKPAVDPAFLKSCRASRWRSVRFRGRAGVEPFRGRKADLFCGRSTPACQRKWRRPLANCH